MTEGVLVYETPDIPADPRSAQL